MNYYMKVAILTYGCILCVQSIAHTLESRSGRQWLCTMQAIERDGFRHLLIFEEPIPKVRLTDLTHAHRCPSCKSKECER